MLMKFVVAGVTSLIAVSAFAMNAADLKEAVALRDGSTVYLFGDGKMGMENPYGRAVLMPEGQEMITVDGKTVRMVGNEVARVSSLTRIDS